MVPTWSIPGRQRCRLRSRLRQAALQLDLRQLRAGRDLQPLLSTIYNFGPALSFDSVIGVAEVASQHIRGSSLKYTAFDGSVRKFSSTTDKAYEDDRTTDSDQISRDSYGYTLLVSGSWNDVYAGVKLSPYLVFQHDFQGNSDRTGNFIEGRKAHTLGSTPPT